MKIRGIDSCMRYYWQQKYDFATNQVVAVPPLSDNDWANKIEPICDRLKQIGFNLLGMDSEVGNQLPFIPLLVPYSHYKFPVMSELWQAMVIEKLEKLAKKISYNPLLVGCFLGNEIAWEYKLDINQFKGYTEWLIQKVRECLPPDFLIFSEKLVGKDRFLYEQMKISVDAGVDCVCINNYPQDLNGIHQWVVELSHYQKIFDTPFLWSELCFQANEERYNFYKSQGYDLGRRYKRNKSKEYFPQVSSQKERGILLKECVRLAEKADIWIIWHGLCDGGSRFMPKTKTWNNELSFWNWGLLNPLFDTWHEEMLNELKGERLC
jgi:hypothetical protein